MVYVSHIPAKTPLIWRKSEAMPEPLVQGQGWAASCKISVEPEAVRQFDNLTMTLMHQDFTSSRSRISTAKATPGAVDSGSPEPSRQDLSPAQAQSGSVPIVEVEALTRRFGALVAVKEVSFQIAAGEIFALIGPNGAGKSTLMKMLTTMLPPSAGRAAVAGYDVAQHPQQVRAHIGYVPQQLSADGDLSGYENMLLSARLYLIPPRERRVRIERALEMMGLIQAQNRLVKTYSGGMARRLEIAQSTLHRPAVLFMDEPTLGLDPRGRHTVWEHVEELKAEIGAAVVFSTHYMDEAEAVCDRVALISDGCLVALGTPEALRLAQGPEATLDDVFESLTGARLAKGAPN